MPRILLFLLFFLSVSIRIFADGFPLRLLNHWDNPNGTIERGYSGRSIWAWKKIPAGKLPMPTDLREKYEEYGRINQSYGINGTVLNNVNAKPEMLSTTMLRKTAKIANILRPYGIRVYLSVNFATPRALGDLPTADPLDQRVQRWWEKKADEIYRLIPDFGGFLVKANSEGEPGPMDYGRTHADGANMLADALLPHGGIVLWRAFVYSPQGGDRANQAYDEFMPFDGQFHDNVIIQIKNGPIDFQPSEPVSPLFFGLKKTKMMLELQITQEYTGQSIHTCFLAPMWHEVLATLDHFATKDGIGNNQSGMGCYQSSVENNQSSIGANHSVPIKSLPNLVGIAGVSNIGDTLNWTSNPLARANWYAFGRLALDPATSSRQIAEDFLRTHYTTDARFVVPVTQLLLLSHQALVNYMMPLGLHHIFAADHHYGPEPWCYRTGWREDWLPRFYHRADTIGIGFNRSNHDEPCLADLQGSGNVNQYPEPLRTVYNDPATCPTHFLLWFHHISWQHPLHNGLSLWDNLCYTYDEGVRQAHTLIELWQKAMQYYPEETIVPLASSAAYQLSLLRRQAEDAQWWRDACLLYFQQFSRLPLPADSPQPKHSLQKLTDYHLDMDNYTAPNPALLP